MSDDPSQARVFVTDLGLHRSSLVRQGKDAHAFCAALILECSEPAVFCESVLHLANWGGNGQDLQKVVP